MNKKIMILLLTVLMLVSCRPAAVEEVPELMTPVGVSMDTAIVKRQDLYKIQRYTGHISTVSEEAYFLVDGKIERLEVSYGDHVNKGDIIARLEDKDLTEQIAALEQRIERQNQRNEFTNQELQLQLELSKNTLNELYAAGVDWSGRRLASLDVEQKELDITQAQERQELDLAQIEEELENLKSQQADKVLKAPVTGHVVYVGTQVVEGGWIKAYQPVYCITDESSLYAVTLQVPDSLLHQAERIRAVIDDKEYEAENVPYSSEDMLTMVLSGSGVLSRFALPKDADVQAGDFVVIYVEALRRGSALTIPANAIYRDEAGSYVYVVEDGSRHRQSVEAGLVTDLVVEIVSGLEEGDEVYVKE